MKGLGPLKSILKGWLVFYLVIHGVSLPADNQLEFSELATGFFYSGLAWLGDLLARGWSFRP